MLARVWCNDFTNRTIKKQTNKSKLIFSRGLILNISNLHKIVFPWLNIYHMSSSLFPSTFLFSEVIIDFSIFYRSYLRFKWRFIALLWSLELYSSTLEAGSSFFFAGAAPTVLKDCKELFTWVSYLAAWATLAKFYGLPPGPPATDWDPGLVPEPAADRLAEFSSCIAS